MQTLFALIQPNDGYVLVKSPEAAYFLVVRSRLALIASSCCKSWTSSRRFQRCPKVTDLFSPARFRKINQNTKLAVVTINRIVVMMGFFESPMLRTNNVAPTPKK